LSWLALGAAILPPLLAVVIADAVGPGPTADAILIAGAVLPMAIYVAAVNRLAPAGGSVLERGVRAKLAAEGLDLGGAEYVSLAPASTTRIYDGFSQWDVGLLWLAGDRLSFVGEHARFALTAEAVVGIRIGRGLPGWLPTRRVYITWRDPVTDAGGTFAVWPGAARSTLRLRIATKAFADRLRGWQAGERTAQPPMALADLGPPAFGTVHGVSPADVVPFRAWLKSFLLLGPLTAGLCLLAGVPFDLTVLSGGGYVLAVTAAALAAQALPYWLARERDAYEEPEYVVEVAESSGTASRD
jgi:hypothetical protein